MSRYLYCPTWIGISSVIDNRDDIGAPIFMGVTITPVLASVADNWVRRASAEVVDAAFVSAGLVKHIDAATAEAAALADQTEADVKALKGHARTAKALIETADAAGIAGLIEEVQDTLRRPTAGDDVRRAERLRDLLEDHATEIGWDRKDVDAAFTRLDAELARIGNARAVLTGLVADLEKSKAEATSPARLHALREQGREVQVRGLIPGIITELATARQEATRALDRLAAIEATLRGAA